ncbi:unnamed protein product [Arctia plantaginis]|uniref:C-type lectin domain-containing protein n=1 Tax=Arctia plantaginis TaxID=874455 RepID=A0A8S0YUU0_ARCPL|nr:unnamed protein product [Arctia plantaginis]
MKFILKYVALVVCFTFIDGVKFRCDYKYTYLGWLKYHEIPATWYDARLQCKFEGGILASPTVPGLKTLMLDLFCKPEIFTGIHATFSKEQYYSVDGIPLAQIPHEWESNEPDNKNDSERCITLNSNGKFSDARCDEPRPYICFRENSQADVNVCGTLDSEYHFESSTNKCYKFHTTPRTFARANFVCSAEGGHLAIINSDEESRVIAQVFAKYPASKMIGNFQKDFAFIGFHNWGESADWTTIHGQSIQEAGFAKFTSGQPDNATTGEYCGSVLRNGLLGDLGCENHFAFICEKSPDYPLLCDNIKVIDESNHNHDCTNNAQEKQIESVSNKNKTNPKHIVPAS